MQGIDREIVENYGLTIKNMIQYKDMYIAVTPDGRSLIRRIPFSRERLRFIHGAKEHLASNGFPYTDMYIKTISGEPGFYYNNCLYALTDLNEGREANFDNDSDMAKASATLALLHKSSAGYKASEKWKIQNELGKLPGYYIKRLDDIKKMKRQAKKGKGRFDQLFLQYADQFISAGERAAAELAASDYGYLTEKTLEEKSFCHHDYTHHNIIIDSAGVSVINFDYCCYELRIYDVANLIRRKMRKCGWDISKACMIIQEYDRVSSLTIEELEIMKIMLQFPQKFWRVVNRYYNSRRSWSEKGYMSRLQEVIDEVGPFGSFIKAYDKLYM